MKTCQALSISNAQRYLLLSLIGVARIGVLAQSTTSCVPHQGDDQHGDSDDDDDNGENDDASDHTSHSFCGVPTGTRTGTWTRTFTGTPGATGNGGSLASASSTGGAARGGNNADISTGGGISKGSIAGIVIAVIVALIVASYALCFFRRRYVRKRRQQQLVKKQSLLGPSFVVSSQPTGTKEGAVVMSNVEPSHPPGLYRSPSRTLPQIPYDTPAYTSTDNLASLSYTHRESTVLSYISPSESTGVTAATAGHGSNGGNGRVSLHEGLVARQKELETDYRRLEMGQLDEHPVIVGMSGAAPIQTPEHPPPRYE
ncbi:uncharacterized protein FOMMEDRAFT_168185 [Fomitiporia mediterranea MF3/22]|uniref:uncharacterized protein n=1 Tax=Fomitiporia mediterranea (strain MF3/22) TaxID=694068 RepID=UPI0004409315|nr:uncharacterized protein FOMMEDRAFT_168185 [Fomitiporia mediterranea MF3/22]EJD03136.1 hypothetical protein FOMMEDRAFT_168185 [Fomitiporia mediterranea MF3/22]